MIEKAFGSSSLIRTILHRNSVCEAHGEYRETGLANPSKVGVELWRGCPACRSESEVVKTRREQTMFASEKQREVEKLFDQTGVPSEYTETSFDNYVVDANPDRQVRALNMSKRFAKNILENPKFKDTLILSGSAGTGKTHLSCAIASAVMHTKSVMFMTHCKLMLEMSESQRFDSKLKPTELINKLVRIDLLIIDEFGTTKPSDNMVSAMMFEVFNGRYANGKPTILITNLDTNGMYMALTERVMDRIKESGFWCDMQWESYRLTKRNKLQAVK